MAISFTSTVNLLFGSLLMVPETGIIMNNEMNDFSIPDSSDAFGYIASPANYVAPHKRPLSSITPVIVEHRYNRTLSLVIGAAGGSRIITATVQGLLNIIDRNMNAREAIDEPRFHEQLVPDQVCPSHLFSQRVLTERRCLLSMHSTIPRSLT
jgi:gamma-glutamyltranspeptidase/glutathione hydrolase